MNDDRFEKPEMVDAVRQHVQVVVSDTGDRVWINDHARCLVRVSNIEDLTTLDDRWIVKRDNYFEHLLNGMLNIYDQQREIQFAFDQGETDQALEMVKKVKGKIRELNSIIIRLELLQELYRGRKPKLKSS